MSLSTFPHAEVAGLDIVDLNLGTQHWEYHEAWDLQRTHHADVVSGLSPNTVFLLEHEDVYTAGRRTEPHERPFDGTPVIDVDRGGKITWHGRGQLVGYPIIRLNQPIDVVAHVRRIEDLLIATCADLGLATTRVDGRSGVWVDADANGPARKVAAIGIRVAEGVTMHGFALNCNNSLEPFHRIVPCGIADASVTTLSNELGIIITPSDAREALAARWDLLTPRVIT